jgi:hypothetical protein
VGFGLQIDVFSLVSGRAFGRIGAVGGVIGSFDPTVDFGGGVGVVSGGCGCQVGGGVLVRDSPRAAPTRALPTNITTGV